MVSDHVDDEEINEWRSVSRRAKGRQFDQRYGMPARAADRLAVRQTKDGFCALATRHDGHESVLRDLETYRTRPVIHIRPSTLAWYSSTLSKPLAQPLDENSTRYFPDA